MVSRHNPTGDCLKLAMRSRRAGGPPAISMYACTYTANHSTDVEEVRLLVYQSARARLTIIIG